MQRLTEHLLDEHARRAEEVAALRTEAAEDKRARLTTHAEMAKAERRQLADDRARLAAETNTLRRQLADERSRLAGDTKAMLSDFDRAHAQMAKTQRRQLADDHARLAADTAALMGELQAESAGVASAWRAMPAAARRLPAARVGLGEWQSAAEGGESLATRRKKRRRQK
jgi:hypothetical protein